MPFYNPPGTRDATEEEAELMTKVAHSEDRDVIDFLKFIGAIALTVVAVVAMGTGLAVLTRGPGAICEAIWVCTHVTDTDQGLGP